MESITEKTTEHLRDLIIINNDRYEGYQKASEHTKDPDLKALFSTLSAQSKVYNASLRSLVPVTEETPDRDETRLSGKFFRTWMDVKNAIDSNNRKQILNSCEQGEDVAKEAYQNVLEEKDELTSNALSTIEKQYQELLKAHDQVKALRDSA